MNVIFSNSNMLRNLIRIIQVLIAAVLLSASASAASTLRIAFVDTGNTGRSMTAAALAQHWANENKIKVSIISRALALNPYNVVPEPDFEQLLKPMDISVSGHRAAQFEKGVVTFSDFIFVMTPAHKDRILSEFPEARSKVYLLSEYATGLPIEIQDAYGKDSAFYDTVFKQINELIPLLMKKLTN